jgi:hypothetical protein
MTEGIKSERQWVYEFRRRLTYFRYFHGGNRGSNPLGDAIAKKHH